MFPRNASNRRCFSEKRQYTPLFFHGIRHKIQFFGRLHVSKAEKFRTKFDSGKMSTWLEMMHFGLKWKTNRIANRLYRLHLSSPVALPRLVPDLVTSSQCLTQLWKWSHRRLCQKFWQEKIIPNSVVLFVIQLLFNLNSLYYQNHKE